MAKATMKVWMLLSMAYTMFYSSRLMTGSRNKKAHLALTNPRDAKACRKLLQFDVKTSCRQVNDLFEIMQQPSAPSGEW